MQLGGGAARGEHGLDDVARARAGGEHSMQVGDRVRDRGMNRRGIKDAVGAGGVAPRLFLRPAVAGRHQPQMEQPAIGHRARAGADIVGELRADQDHHGRVAGRRKLRAAVAAGHQRVRLQLVPRAPSSSTIPCAASSARIASARAKSRAMRAA